uniref:Uncharacterized protein n=1 Tax=Strombidium inclinatum TaxID=197538 RepID=A0A7S3MVD6_9SPIT
MASLHRIELEHRSRVVLVRSDEILEAQHVLLEFDLLRSRWLTFHQLQHLEGAEQMAVHEVAGELAAYYLGEYRVVLRDAISLHELFNPMGCLLQTKPDFVKYWFTDLH